MEIKKMTAAGGREGSGELNLYPVTAELLLAFFGAWAFVPGRSWSMQTEISTKVPKCAIQSIKGSDFLLAPLC